MAALLFSFITACTSTTPPDDVPSDNPGDVPDDDPGDKPSDDPDDTAELTAEQKFWREVLASADEYRIIRSADLDGDPRLMALSLRYALQSVSGKSVKLYSDINVEAQPKEIIVGVTERLGDSYTSEINDSELKSDAYVIEYKGESAIIHYGGLEGFSLAVKEIIGYICEPSGKDANALYNTVVAQAGVKPGNVSLTNVYANGMVFQQNKPAVIEGFGDEGSVVTAKLFNAKGEKLSEAKCEVGAEGKWSLSLDGQVGSYDAYTVEFSVAGIRVHKLSDIVFGEVWVATGQSNMLYQLSKDVEYKTLTINDKYMKLLTIGKPRTDGGYSPVPMKANENPTVKWSSGAEVASRMSAVAYYYAAELREKLDVPVGIIQYAVGGVPIRSWLSDETIRSSSEIFEHYKSNGTYVTEEKWVSDNNARKFASAFYNTMACLAEHFNVAGLIWYQGEQDSEEDVSEVKAGKTSTYLKELELLYGQYCDMYGFKNGDMPMVYTLLVPYRNTVSSVYFGEFSAEFATFASKHEMVGAVAIYDQSPFYDKDNTADHPNSKRLAGERMARSALALAYGGKAPVSSPSPVSYVKEDGAIIITFRDVADGLIINSTFGGGNYLKGFTVCGEDGVYVMANAEIIGKDKVKVYSPYVASPVSVTYAYEILQRNCNLGCSLGDELYNMAVPFCLGEPEEAHHTSYFYWMGCDVEKIFRIYSNYSYELPLWVDSTPADSDVSISLSYNTEKKHGGSSSLSISHSGEGLFGVGVTSTYKLSNTLGTNEKNIIYKDTYTDLSHFTKLSFYVKNEGTSKITVSEVNLGGYSAAFDTTSASLSVDADGEWHRIVIDLNTLSLSGVSYTSAALTSVEEITVDFTTVTDGVILLDDFELIP